MSHFSVHQNGNLPDADLVVGEASKEDQESRNEVDVECGEAEGDLVLELGGEPLVHHVVATL